MSKRKATKQINVSWHDPSRQYRRYVGKHIGRNGTPRPRCFYLGSDEAAAIRKAVALVAEWNELTAQGHRVWPSSVSAPKKNEQTRRSLSTVGQLTVRDGANLYLAWMKQRAEAGQISWSHYRKTFGDIKRGIEPVGGKTPLSSIGDQELTRTVLHFASRPKVMPRPGQEAGLERPISVSTAIGTIKALKAMFRWIDRHDGVEWRSPRRFDEIFQIRRNRMQTAEEQATLEAGAFRNTVKIFAEDELRQLFQAANSRDRAFLLAAINLGFTSADLSELRIHNLGLDSDPCVLHAYRHKTGVYANWILWPETTEAIRAEMSDLTNSGRVFVGRHGRSLVEVGQKGRRDDVATSFMKLRKRAGIPSAPTFKHLRKHGATIIKEIGGVEISAMYLAHSESDRMNKHYADRMWPQMHECLLKMRERLLPIISPPEDRGSQADQSASDPGSAAA